MKSLLTLSLLALATMGLAGCADDAATGTLSYERAAITDSTNQHLEVVIDFIEAENPYHPDPVPAEAGPVSGTLCTVADAVGGAVPDVLPVCVSPGTTVSVTAHGLKDPNSDGYSVWFDAEAPILIGTLTGDSEAGYTLEATFEEYLDVGLNGTQLKMGDLIIASGTANDGSNTLEVAEEAKTVRFTGTFEGDALTLDVSGLPTGSFDGWLVSMDEETGELVHDVSFPVTNGANTYMATDSLDAWVEFHIHAAGSSVNYAIGSITLD